MKRHFTGGGLIFHPTAGPLRYRTVEVMRTEVFFERSTGALLIGEIYFRFDWNWRLSETLGLGFVCGGECATADEAISALHDAWVERRDRMERAS